MAESAHVIVIGAGLAGLTATRELQRAGLKVLLLEARDRVGGRVSSQVAGGLTLDLGAQFLSDAQPHVSQLVDEFRLTRVAPYRGGRRVTERRAVTAQLDRAQFDVRLIGHVLAFKLGASTRSESAAAMVERMTWGRTTRSALIRQIEAELCMPLNKVSASELVMQVASMRGGLVSSEQWFLADGAQAIADGLATECEAAIRLAQPVSAISLSPDGVEVETSAGRFLGTRAIIAVPPQIYGAIGVLPHLPDGRQNVLAGWQSGCVVKTILVYEKPWWRDRGFSGISDGAVGPFDATVDASPTNGSHGVLVLFAGAGRAEEMLEHGSAEDRVMLAKHWASRLFGDNASKIIVGKSIDWVNDPFSRGGYASRRGITSGADAPGLFTPIRNLHFAGSETADHWRSFMDGAIQSGVRAAREAIESLAGLVSSTARADTPDHAI